MTPTNGLKSFNEYANQSQYVMESMTEYEQEAPTNFQRGFEPLETLPATWFNTMIKSLTQQAGATKSLCDSMFAELKNVITDAEIELSASDVEQVKKALHKLFDLHIATETLLGGIKSSRALTKCSVGDTGLVTPNALADWDSLNTVKAELDTINQSITDIAADLSTNYKPKQTAVPAPTTSGSSIAFVDSITQDVDGVISVTKKNVQSATTAASGVVMLATDTPQKDGTGDAGTSTTVAKADHVHPLNVDTTAPANVKVQTAAVGSATTYARRDHLHNIDTATGVLIGAASGTTYGSNATGSSASLARADHTHQLRITDATTQVKGVVQLSDATNSTSTALAATANRVKVLTDSVTAQTWGTARVSATVSTSQHGHQITLSRALAAGEWVDVYVTVNANYICGTAHCVFDSSGMAAPDVATPYPAFARAINVQRTSTTVFKVHGVSGVAPAALIVTWVAHYRGTAITLTDAAIKASTTGGSTLLRTAVPTITATNATRATYLGTSNLVTADASGNITGHTLTLT